MEPSPYIVHTTRDHVQSVVRETLAIARDPGMRVIIIVHATGSSERPARSWIRHFLGSFRYLEVCPSHQ